MLASAVVREAKLDMKVTDVEFQGDGTRAVVYYTAEDRIDFPGHRRTMSGRLQGARGDETDRVAPGRRVIGGIGSCGRELCCSTWLTDFEA